MEFKRFGDIVSIKKGKKIEQVEKENNTIRYIQIDDLRNDNNLKYCNKDDSYITVNEKDIVIAWDGANAGTVGYGLNGAIGSTLAKLEINDTEFNTIYCALFLRSKFYYLREKCTGATIPHLSRSSLEDLKLPKLNIDTQNKIVEILDKSQELIDKRKEQMELLDELVQSRFLEMFGNPITNSKNLSVKNFEEVIVLQRGYDLPTYKRDESGAYNVWGSNGILSKHNEYKVNTEGVITGRSGSLGNVYYTKEPYWPLNTTLFSKDTCGNNVVYLTYLLRFYDLKRFSNGTGVPTLNRNLLNGEKIIDVPLALQEEFADFVEKVNDIKSVLNKSLKQLNNNFDSLMQKAFKGELF